MSNKLFALADKLEAEGKLGREEYLMLIENNSSEVARYLAEKALAVKEKHYGNKKTGLPHLFGLFVKSWGKNF